MKDGDFHSPERFVFAPEASDTTHRGLDCDRKNKSRSRRARERDDSAKYRRSPPRSSSMHWTTLSHHGLLDVTDPCRSSATLRFDKRVSTFPKSRGGTGGGCWCKHQQLHWLTAGGGIPVHRAERIQELLNEKDIIFECDVLTLVTGWPVATVTQVDFIGVIAELSRSSLCVSFGGELSKIILLAQRFDRFPRRQICPELCTCAASSGHLDCRASKALGL